MDTLSNEQNKKGQNTKQRIEKSNINDNKQKKNSLKSTNDTIKSDEKKESSDKTKGVSKTDEKKESSDKN